MAASTALGRVLRWLPLMVGVGLAAGCGAVPPRPDRIAARPPTAEARYEALAWTEIPGWGEAALAPGLRAFLVGCTRVGSTSRWQVACEQASEVPADDEAAARRFFESAFRPYRLVSTGSEQALITGYYEPILPGRRTPDATFRIPVFGVPDDLIVVDLAPLYPELATFRLRGRLEGRRLVPYHSRREIEHRARAGADGPGGLPAPVLAWVADPLDLFFLQVQGSGQIELPSGERVRLGYAEHNGHPYRSLGRHLVDQGELPEDQVSMQSIKAWAAANPTRLRAALDHNPSYVFFRELPANEAGPLGSLGVPLTPGYSVAVDPRYVPLGAPVFLATTDPLSEQPFERLMVAQDTGGAIRGPLRADVFWGAGPEAGERAGRMREAGRLWLLLPRRAAPP